MANGLTPRQKNIVAREIKKEFRLKQMALVKRRGGKKLSDTEQRRIKRPTKQVVRIGFEKAREIDKTIPEVDDEEMK